MLSHLHSFFFFPFHVEYPLFVNRLGELHTDTTRDEGLLALLAGILKIFDLPSEH